MPTILVTGGAGYIGSHACKAVAGAGYTPVAFDNLSRGHDWAVKWGPLERGDILDRAALDTVMARHRPEAVLHFAAFAYIGESMADPALYYRNNVVGTLTVLDAMRAAGVSRVVFSSSCTTYGVATHAPVTEDTPQAPISPYGASKLMIEQVLADYATAYGLRAAALRYFNAAGADPDAEIGEDHDPEPHLIPSILDAAALRRAVTVHGEDYPTPDGTCVRDYTHVSDLADAHVLACRSLEREPGLRAYNFGTGTGFSVAEIIGAVSRRLGRDIQVVSGPRRPGDPPVLTADSRRAIQELGWRPRLSNLDDIIDTAWRWRQRHFGPSPGDARADLVEDAAS